MTPAPIQLPNWNNGVTSMESRAGATVQTPKRPILFVTSISTTLLISYDKNLEFGTKKVSDMSTKGQMYVIQGILSEVERLVTAIAAAATDLNRLFKRDDGEALNVSTKNNLFTN
jgi:hypothetical protein